MPIVEPKHPEKQNSKSNAKKYQLANYHHNDSLQAMVMAIPMNGFPVPYYARIGLPLQLKDDEEELMAYIRQQFINNDRRTDRPHPPIPHKPDWSDFQFRIIAEMPILMVRREIGKLQPYSAGQYGRGRPIEILDQATGEIKECSSLISATKWAWDYMLEDSDRLGYNFERFKNCMKRGAQTGHLIFGRFKLRYLADTVRQYPLVMPERVNSAQLRAAESAMRFMDILPEAEDAEEEVDELADIF